jgi:predicted unusual protein kinase regulating ubiquinone biosynthesis (AarF/ABC1/UbiB family)
LTFVDFGMVGHVPESLRSGLRETIIGVGTRDAARLIRSYKSLGFLLPGTDTHALEQAMALVFDRFWGLSMSDIRSVRPAEFRDIGHRMREVMVDLPLQVPNDLLMLIRTVAILSGMCTGLDPDFNLWEQLSPYARKLVDQEASSAFNLEKILGQLGEFVQALALLPSQARRVLAQVEAGGLVVQSPQVTREMGALTRSVDRLTAGMVFTALLISGVMLVNSGNIAWGNGLLGAAGATFLWVLLGGRKKK